MSDDLRERVARAIAYSGDIREKREWSELLPETRSHYRKQADAALAEIGGGEWTDKPDDWTDRIKADFRTDGFYSRYAQALDLVGNRHSKSALVALVCYLLRPSAIEPAPVSVREAARVLYDMPEADRMKAWKATRDAPPEFAKWFCAALRAIAEGEE